MMLEFVPCPDDPKYCWLSYGGQIQAGTQYHIGALIVTHWHLEANTLDVAELANDVLGHVSEGGTFPPMTHQEIVDFLTNWSKTHFESDKLFRRPGNRQVDNSSRTLLGSEGIGSIS